MAWLKRSAGQIIDRGESTITWTTPSGFEVVQDLKKANSVRIQTRIMGGARININVADGFTDEPDRDHHKSALAPNVVHSNDASLLHLTLRSGSSPSRSFTTCPGSVL